MSSAAGSRAEVTSLTGSALPLKAGGAPQTHWVVVPALGIRRVADGFNPGNKLSASETNSAHSGGSVATLCTTADSSAARQRRGECRRTRTLTRVAA